MKKYILFQYLDYYPDGGMGDFAGSFSSGSEILNFCKSQRMNYDSYEVVDRDTWEIMKEFRGYDLRSGRVSLSKMEVRNDHVF